MKEHWAKHRIYFEHPAFWGALALKMAAGSLFASHYLRDLFIPFIRYFVESGFANPWVEFLRRNEWDAFPYSSVSLIALAIPESLGALICGGVAQIPGNVELFLMRLPLAAADVLIYWVLCDWFQAQWKSVLWIYWFSPILFFISYVHGQLDVIPTALLMLSLRFAAQQRAGSAGVALAAGIAAKFHVAAAVPLIAFSLFQSQTGTKRLSSAGRFAGALAIGLIILIGPLLFLPGYQSLVVGAKESRWILDMAWPMPLGMKILFCPLALTALVLHFFSYESISRDILILYTGLLFTILILLVPPMPGWAYWSVPFICYFLVRHDVKDYVPFWTYSAAYLVYYGAFAPGIGRWGQGNVPESISTARDLSFTVMQGALTLVSIWMYRIGVKNYVKYRHVRDVLAIGIGGDSAAGKHTLTEALSLITGPLNTVHLHGDDYHRWPRDHEVWKKQTHLDPRSNYFRQPVQHIEDLKGGRTIFKRTYDHTAGIFTPEKPVTPKPYIFFEGLHPLLYQRMRDVFDIKIFLATEDSLRRQWKMDRDTQARGHTPQYILEQIESRQADSLRYIRPQARYADWVIEYSRLKPGHPKGNEPNLFQAIHQISTNVVELEGLQDELSAYASRGLSVQWSIDRRLLRHIVKVHGVLPSTDVASVAHTVFPTLERNLGQECVWLSDLNGVNQLIFLAVLQRQLDW